MPQSVTVKEIQELDRIAIEECHVPSLALMENAGNAVARESLNRLPDRNASQIVVICGTGNNAGDGFVAARHLLNAGVRVAIVSLANPEVLKNDALVNFKILKDLSCPIYETASLNEAIIHLMKESNLIIDAVFGVGLNREIRSPFKEWIMAINESHKKVLSVDIPSGLNADTGNFYGVCVQASVTVTFSFAKKGFFLAKGKEAVGDLKVVDIGIPHKLYERIHGSYH